MSESVTEPQDVIASDAAPEATPASTIDDTMSAAFDKANAEPEAETTEPAPTGQERGPDGKFIAAANPDDADLPASEQPQPAPPQNTVPDYIAPYQAEFAQRGMRPEDAVPRLIETWRNLEANPRATLEWLGRQYGLNPFAEPAQPAQPTQQPEEQEWVDPAVLALRQELDQLKQRDQMREAQAQAAQAEAYQRAYASVHDEVQSFAQNKARADGVNFDALRPTMAALISSGQASDLSDAYEKAVWANPTTRAAKLEAERKQSEAAKAAENATKAAAARRAGQVNVRTDTAIPAKGRTLDETMSLAYDRAMNN
jgi:hypothetical protein